jgi:hypothetical protein
MSSVRAFAHGPFLAYARNPILLRKNLREVRPDRSPVHVRIEPLAITFADQVNPSFLDRRQQHMNFDFSSALTPPQEEGISAGIAALQSDEC